MTDPKTELREYLKKLIGRFVFITQMDDDLKTMQAWETRPAGINALVEGASFFNLVQKTFNQTLLIELCKFIDEDEEKSLRDLFIKCKICAKPLEPTSFKVIKGKIREVIPPDNYRVIVNNLIAKLDAHNEIIENLKTRRDKALAHTDASFFNNPDKHYETYPLMAADITQLLKTVDKILKEQALYLLEADYDFKLYTNSGVDRVLEFMRAYFTMIQENSELIKYRFDKYYN